jgi:hypothetical protein
MKKVSVKKSKIHGNGLFAEEQIKRGDTIGVAHQVLNTSNHKLFVPTGIVGKNYNHSKNNPNAENIMDGNKRYLVALTDIKPGTEITSNYYNTPDMEQPKKEWEDKLANGGESTNCPEGYYYDPVQGCIPNDEHQKWLRDWYTNRKMDSPEGQEILKKVQPEILKRAENFPPYLMTEELPENTPASYDLEKNAVMLNKFLPEKMLEESKTHEGAHYLTSGDKFLNLFDKQIGYVVNNNVIDDPKKINTGNEKWDKELRKNFDYAVSPEEMYAKIMTLRRDAGFDPAKSITLQDLEDYFTKVKDSGSSLNPDIEELKAVTKDKQAIVNLLNDLVLQAPVDEEMQFAKKGGSIKKFNPGGIVNDLPQNVGVSYLQNEDRSYYDPISDTVNLNPNATDAELNHELVHAWQNRTGRLRTNPNLPQQRPPIVASDEQAASYYTRKGDDVDYYLNNLTTLVPEFGGHTWNEDLNRFIPEELKYNKVIDPIMYSDPNTMEGEAEFLSQTKGRPGGIGFRQSGGSSNDAFQKKLEEVAKRLKVSKSDLLGIMKHESGLNPHAVNPYTGATGLIQFMPTTAKRLGTSVQELRNMSAIEQLNYVEKFYRPVAGRAKDIGDLYMFTFLPAVVGKPNDYVIGAKGSGKSIYGLSQDALYRQNAGFDKDKKGYYTVGDVKARIAKYSTSKGKLKEDTPSRKVESKTPGIKMESTPLDKDIPIEEYSEIKYNPVEKVEQPVRPKYTLEQAMFEMGAVETPTSTPQMSAVLKFLSPKRFNPGQVQASLTDNEIQQYIKGGYVVEEVTPKKQNGGEATPPKIWVKSKDDPRYKDYLTRQALYNYSNTPNFNLRDAAEYDLYNSIKDNNFDKFTNDYYSNLLKTIEKEKEENKDTGEWDNTYYKQILEDPYYGAYGSKVNYETLINPNMVNQPDFSSSLFNQPEIMPFFTQYPPREWEKKTEYINYPFSNYYDTNANAPYGSKNYWSKPDTLLIEDEINRANLKNIYPNLSEEDIQKAYQEMITEPGYISNEYNSQWNYYPYVTTENYSTGEYLADPKQPTFTDSDGRKGYLPESIQDNIYNTFEYTPRWDKPEQAYGIIPDPIIINPPKLENPSNLTLRPSTELPEPIEAPQYTLDPYTADRLSLDVKLPQNKIARLFDRGVIDSKGHIELGKKNKTRLIPRIVQKVTGYDPAYFEGYEDEEGNFVPGELDYGNEVGGKMEFKGAASLKDLMNQQKYKKEYEEYDKKLDEWFEKYEQSKKKQEQGQAFKKGGQYKLGEVVDELTKKKLEKLGYTFEIVK